MKSHLFPFSVNGVIYKATQAINMDAFLNSQPNGPHLIDVNTSTAFSIIYFFSFLCHYPREILPKNPSTASFLGTQSQINPLY